MSSRRWLRPAAALASIAVVGSLLLAAAGPLSAASTNKTYTVTVSPTNLPYSSTSSVQSQFTVTYQNLTPSATINSLTLQAPSGYQITTLPSLTASSGTVGNFNIATVPNNVTGPWTQISVTNLYPVGYQQTVSLTFWATVDTSSLNCSNNVGTWTTAAYTGSNLGGNSFGLVFPGGTPTNTTTIGTALLHGATITVNGVTVTNNGACALITLSRSGNNVTVLKPTGSNVNLTVDILWNAEKAPVPPATLAPTQVDTPSPTHAIEWCNGTPSYDSSGNLITSGLSMPGSEVSCLVKETTQIVGPDSSGNQQVQVHDVVLLDGDWAISR